MESAKHAEDIEAIEALISRQFESLTWAPGKSANWAEFAADFIEGASLYPSARPANAQTVEGFIERMKGLAGTKLRSFHEQVLGTEVRIFGSVAVAVAACEITENETEISRGVEMLLLVKSNETWRIVSQAWDQASRANPIPNHLARGPRK